MVQQHLPKSFEGMHTLVFEETAKGKALAEKKAREAADAAKADRLKLKSSQRDQPDSGGAAGAAGDEGGEEGGSRRASDMGKASTVEDQERERNRIMLLKLQESSAGLGDSDPTGVLDMAAADAADEARRQKEIEDAKAAEGTLLITGMKSADGEHVPFAPDDVVDPNRGLRRGNVEVWMAEVEESMRGSVRLHTMRALHDFVRNVGLPEAGVVPSQSYLDEYAVRREEWSSRWPGQVVLAVDQIVWTYGSESVLRLIEKRSLRRDATDDLINEYSRQHLEGYHAMLGTNLRAIVRRVRAPLNVQRRITLSALTTLSVHGRDVVDGMLKRGTATVHDFEWYSQLRYYWEHTPSEADGEHAEVIWKGTDGASIGRGASFEAPEAVSWRRAEAARRGKGKRRRVAVAKNKGGGLAALVMAATGAADEESIAEAARQSGEARIPVRVVNATQHYGWEYIGNTGRLVVTPLTDRCYRTLMGAISLMYGGSPEGPAGTGKTETTKDLAKAVAQHCLVFNCSEGLDVGAMGKFFRGLASSGAWSCFDEFNRIEKDVLSVVAQQILTIQTAKRQGLSRFVPPDSTVADVGDADAADDRFSIPLKSSCNVFITMNPGYAGRTELPDNLKALFRTVAMMRPDFGLIAEIKLYSYGFVQARQMARKIVQVLRLASQQLSKQQWHDFGMRAVKAILDASGLLKRAADADAAMDVPHG